MLVHFVHLLPDTASWGPRAGMTFPLASEALVVQLSLNTMLTSTFGVVWLWASYLTSLSLISLFVCLLPRLEWTWGRMCSQLHHCHGDSLCSTSIYFLGLEERAGFFSDYSTSFLSLPRPVLVPCPYPISFLDFSRGSCPSSVWVFFQMFPG